MIESDQVKRMSLLYFIYLFIYLLLLLYLEKVPKIRYLNVSTLLQISLISTCVFKCDIYLNMKRKMYNVWKNYTDIYLFIYMSP